MSRIVFFILSISMFTSVRAGENQAFPLRIPKSFQTASQPTKFFVSPTSRVLRSMEISLSGGSSYGVEQNENGLLTRFGLGMGGVAEIEFSTTQVVNQLTGDETRFPSRTLKVQLVPERFARSPFIPRIAVQLRTSSWAAVVDRDTPIAGRLSHDYALNHKESNLEALNLRSRFTTLHMVAGKEWELGGFYFGYSLTDVRTKEGGQWIFDNTDYSYRYYLIPEMKKNILKPFGGILIKANASTRLLAEIYTVPNYRYNIKNKSIDITRAWVGIAGVRFTMMRWLSWDAGVRYLSTYDGIADAEICLNLNLILPLKSPSQDLH